MTLSAFEGQVAARFGVVPSFFRSASAAPEIMENFWDFAQATYLDSPLPSLFKERLFVYLSRFCEVRYCLVRHLGFLIGRGRPAGDDTAQVVTIEEAIEILKRPAPSRDRIDAAILRLESIPAPITSWPDSDSELDDAIFACATMAFLEPARSGPARWALTIALGSRRFEQLIAYLAFIRMAHFWTLTHPDLEIEPDMDALLRDHDELSRLVFEDPEAGRGDMGQRLWEELQTLRGEKKPCELLEALPTPTYTTDAAGRLTYYNQAAADLWGYRPDLRTAKWCGSWRLYWPDGTPLPHDECPMAVALKQDRPIRGAEAIAERPDGTRIPFTPHPTPLHDDSGKLVGAVNMLVDLSEHKRAEAAAQWLAAIVDSSHDAIVSKDLNGIITSWNAGAERLFGYTADEAIGQPITMLIPPDRIDEEPEILGCIRRGEHVRHFETVRMRKDGSLIDISLTISPVKNASGNITGISKIARDISERKQAQARQELLTREIHHRTKNLFAVVQAVVDRSFAGKQTVEDAKSAVISRLASLAQTHVMLIDTQWKGADLRELVEVEMSPFAGRVRIEGPEIMLTPQAAQNFSLAIHELATNAAKYGALSNLTGQVDISWSVGESNSSRAFALRWQEFGGPLVEKPEHKGFGSTVLERVMREYFAEPPRIDFAPSGVRYELNAPLEAVAAPDWNAREDDVARRTGTRRGTPTSLKLRY